MLDDEVDVKVYQSDDGEMVGLAVGKEVALLTQEQARDTAVAILHCLNKEQLH